MKQTPETLLALAQKTASSLSNGSWPSFLRTAAWNFKYDFTSQLLIFARKPDATACAPHALWVSAPFLRQPRKGTAIALLAENGPEPDVRYVFDISDTYVKKGARGAVNPVWEVAEDKELTVRQALAAAFLPHAEHTPSHSASQTAEFYRSIARSITEPHFEDALKALNNARSNCALDSLSESETEQIFRSLLTESVSAMLQFRCGLIPEVNESVLDKVRLFNSIESIMILGKTVQETAKLGLLEMAHAVHTCDAEHREPQKQTHRKAADREEDPFGICEEDIDRAITIGPPLEGGKYRLQRAAEDPNITSEQFEAILRTEYGTGKQAFLLICGIDGTLSWGPQGLKIARNGLQEGSDLTLPWKTASERLRGLIKANLYLSDSEKHNMSAWVETQNTIYARQITGAALSAALKTLLPTRQDLPGYLEQIRAYVYDNSESARLALCDVLKTLSASERISGDPESQALLQTLKEFLSNHPKGEKKTEPSIPKQFDPGSLTKKTPHDHPDCDPGLQTLQKPCNANPLYNNNSEIKPAFNCTPVLLKDFRFSVNSSCADGSESPPPAKSTSIPSNSEPSAEPLGATHNVPSTALQSRPPEPLIDHPELRQKELHRLDRSDKVALADLLYHYNTYRYTFTSHSPRLCAHDAASREEQLATLDEMLVSSSVEENLKRLSLASSILARWFLPFDGIRPEILAEQDRLLEAAQQVLSNPPSIPNVPVHNSAHDYDYNYNYDYKYAHTEPFAPVSVSSTSEYTLWNCEPAQEGQEDAELLHTPLSDKIRNAQSRIVVPPQDKGQENTAQLN